ncbi:hypothetical protein Nepgr_026020 [Nepenthes gracilis]|uniref:Uncharacterized protein n=1 Tax=Nepenthes gracilis TaxID=150966 RepID=A0AAD3Y009_NEPGR|nr:hypothetical protein Nepgr_026020 [Nepenthes gracilis]
MGQLHQGQNPSGAAYLQHQSSKNASNKIIRTQNTSYQPNRRYPSSNNASADRCHYQPNNTSFEPNKQKIEHLKKTPPKKWAHVTANYTLHQQQEQSPFPNIKQKSQSHSSAAVIQHQQMLEPTTSEN